MQNAGYVHIGLISETERGCICDAIKQPRRNQSWQTGHVLGGQLLLNRMLEHRHKPRADSEIEGGGVQYWGRGPSFIQPGVTFQEGGDE